MLEGKRNRRMDNLIYVLLHNVIPHFCAKHRRQQFGFEGPDLEVQRQNEAETNAHTFTLDDIKVLVDGQSYLVNSRSDPSRKYIVDVNYYTCECDAYHLILQAHMCCPVTIP